MAGFSETVLSLSSGATVADLNRSLKDVVAAVQATGKPGAITLKLKVIPGSKASTEVVFVEPEIKTTLPTKAKEQTLFYTTEEHGLSRKNERQRDLFSDARVVEVIPGSRDDGVIEVLPRNRDAGDVKEVAS